METWGAKVEMEKFTLRLFVDLDYLKHDQSLLVYGENE